MLEKEGQVRIPSGCAITGFINKDGHRTNGRPIIESIRPMHERSNGLGGGFAGYGIYPEYKDYYAFHLFYDDTDAKEECEKYIKSRFNIVDMGAIPVDNKMIEFADKPLIWRYFLEPIHTIYEKFLITETQFVARCVMFINANVNGAFVFSSGKNMGVFKAVGYPEDVGEFYLLDQYEGYSWTCHGRYPTNTPGWWGGAHPFALLDYSLVHNGEISSYDANRRYIEMFNYKCTLQTDTEAITYIVDYLINQEGLTLNEVSNVIAAPFWSTIESKPPKERERLAYLRNKYASLLVTGPFSIILGFTGGLMALNDRLKLRSMVIGEKGETVFISSEECGIRAICPDADNIWSPRGGEPVIVKLNESGEGK